MTGSPSRTWKQNQPRMQNNRWRTKHMDLFEWCVKPYWNGLASNPVLVTKTPNGLLSIEIITLSVNYHLVDVTNGVMDVSLQWLFHIYVSNLSRWVARLPKHVIVAQIKATPAVIQAICNESRSASRLRTPKSITKFMKFLKISIRAECKL